MKEPEYLSMLAQLHQARWPNDIPREPRYPFAQIPLSAYLSEWARRQPTKTAINFYGAQISYGDLDRLSDKFAQAMQDMGIRKGDRVALLMPNCPQYMIGFFGILKLGAILVPVNPMFKEAELIYELDDTSARLIVVADSLLGLVENVLAQSSLETVLVTSVGEMAPDTPDIAFPSVLETPKIVPEWTRDFLPLLEDTAIETDFCRTASLDDIAAINYTGGSTGMPKGCVHTQGDMVYTAATTVELSLGLENDSHYLCVLPIFWMAGEVFGIVFPIFAGATVSLLTRWDPLTAMAVIDRHDITHTSLLVDGLVEIMQHDQLDRFDLTRMQSVQGISFVKKLNPDLRKSWKALTGTSLREVGWGMTETHTCDTMNKGFDKDDFDLRSQPIFAGIPVPGSEFKIVDFETGALKPLNEEGEICIRSPSMLKEYWQSPKETAMAIRDGWLHTGDIGLFDDLGFLHFLGRRKEMLKVNGMSVFPGEIETLLGQYPGLSGSGVIGRPDPDKGEVPVAFVVLDESLRTPQGEAAFIEWCRGKISSYKTPEFRFVDSLPMTDTGKVKKDILRDRIDSVS